MDMKAQRSIANKAPRNNERHTQHKLKPAANSRAGTHCQRSTALNSAVVLVRVLGTAKAADAVNEVKYCAAVTEHSAQVSGVGCEAVSASEV
jgi:hypothetical protein